MPQKKKKKVPALRKFEQNGKTGFTVTLLRSELERFQTALAALPKDQQKGKKYLQTVSLAADLHKLLECQQGYTVGVWSFQVK